MLNSVYVWAVARSKELAISDISLVCSSCLPSVPPSIVHVLWYILWVPSGPDQNYLVSQFAVSCLACFFTCLSVCRESVEVSRASVEVSRESVEVGRESVENIYLSHAVEVSKFSAWCQKNLNLSNRIFGERSL